MAVKPIKQKFLILATIISILTLSGCSMFAGAAATVGKTRIEKATVQASIDSILAERSKVDITQMQLETGADLARSQLRLQVMILLLKAIGQDLKLDASKKQIAARRVGIVTQVGGIEKLPAVLVSVGLAPIDLEIWLEAVVYTDQIRALVIASGVAPDVASGEIQKLIIAKAIQVKVKINKDYGKWDEITGDVVANV